MQNIIVHLKSLIQLAVVDNKFDESERRMVLAIGKANGVPQQVVEDLIFEGLKEKQAESLNFTALTFDERFEFLYNIIQLMKIDREIFLSEIKYCEGIAEKLGFDKGVVSMMSAKIYSDPAITADRDALKRDIKKYIA
jgi:uncharacterized tellurite resistance protein B-like protein